jgi:hypothetical protein
MTIPTKTEFFEVFRKYRTDKGEMHGYNYMYNALFQTVGEPQKLLEIGIKRGFSIAAWKHLFPECEVVGVDINQREDIVQPALLNTLHFLDSCDPTIKEVVGNNYDVIIDDGSHRVDDQWKTFLNLKECWTKAYVIEDIVGIEGELVLRRRLKSHGYKHIETYDSYLKNVKIQRTSGNQNVNYYAIVVYKT